MTAQAGVSPVAVVLIVILLAIVLLVILLVLVLRKARKTAVSRPEEPGEAGHARIPALSRHLPTKGMMLSFSRGLDYLKYHVAGRDYRYGVPWLLMMGPQGAGTTTVLANAGGSAPLAREGGPTFGIPGGPEWWFYDRGLVLNAPGDMVRRSDGHTSDHVAWSALLQLLVRRRARRPLDAVILTISAEDLVQDSNSRDAGIDITASAEVLSKKLSQIRRTVSMRLPVYVLVTKSDLLPGFSSFASEVPPELHAEIFGWSNPYPLEAAFSPDWVDQCCREMHDRIVEQQMEIFVERNQLQEPDGVFLFPSEFLSLRAPLRRYLAFIFQSTAYQESYYFRGIYFCGDVNAVSAPVVRAEPVVALAVAARAGSGLALADDMEAPQTGVIPAEPATPALHEGLANRDRRPMFLQHLFERKIFPEAFLGRPLSVIDMSRNRTVLTAQILTAVFALVAGIGTAAAYVRFSSLRQQRLGPLFQQLADDVHRDDSKRARLGQETPAERDARVLRATRDANNVLSSMALLSQERLHSVFMPASWNGVVDRDTQAALAKAFGTIVLTGFRVDLTLRLGSLIKATTPHLLDSSGTTTAGTSTATVETPPAGGVFDSIGTVPEYQAWGQYIAGLRELELNVARYNRIATPGGGSADDLKELLKYLQLDNNVPPDFDFENPYFEGMLQQASNRQFSFENSDPSVIDSGEAVKHAHDLIQGFFASWYGPDNRVMSDVDQMTAAIDRFPARGASVSYQALKDIADSIGAVSDDLENPAFQWLNDEDFNLSRFPAFNQPINDLQYLQGLQFANEIADHGKGGLRKFTADLAAESTRLTGQVLGMDTVPVQLTSSVATLQANLRVLLDQIFVAREPGPARQLDTALAMWDRNALLEADKLVAAYNKYAQGSLRTAPPVIREALQRVAVERLQQNVLDDVGQAQSAVAPGSPDGADVQSFNQSLDVLQRLLGEYAELADPAAARNFSTVLTTQASRMLVTLANELNAQNLYAVKDQNFDWWEGEKPLSLAAYDEHGADDLKDYVDHERGQVSALSQQADPMVKFLRPRSAGLGKPQAQAMSDWYGISQQLTNYANKTPGNSVQLLEDFIRTGLDKIAPDTSCQDNTRDPAGRSDYFLTRRSTLRTEALARCRVLSQRAYSMQIATLFNQRLAARFPFSATSPQSPLEEADPASLVAFFAKFDQYGKVATDSLNQNVPPGPQRDAALGFLSQMGAIRPVFASFLAGAEKNPVPEFNFIVNFRVNQGKEIEGNQIIDWGLDVGQQSFQYRAKQKTGLWRLGDPVRLSLRFADDSPLVPTVDSNQSAMTVHQRTVSFEYTDAWSLLSLLAEHKPSAVEFNRGVDPSPQTLSFYIPTAPDRSLPQPKNGTAAGQVRVYIQITVVPVGAKDGVNVPMPFPAQAPVIPEK